MPDEPNRIIVRCIEGTKAEAEYGLRHYTSKLTYWQLLRWRISFIGPDGVWNEGRWRRVNKNRVKDVGGFEAVRDTMPSSSKPIEETKE
jgi:hypothetical protein